MNKIEFMNRLSYLLQDLSKEEQEDALQYYEDYFDDAGMNNESNIINELGSPEKVAAIIRDDLRNIDGIKDSGEFTESGYKDPFYKENYYEVMPKNIVKNNEKEIERKAEKNVDDYFDNDYFNPNYKHNTDWNDSSNNYSQSYYNDTYQEQRYSNNSYQNDKYQNTYKKYDYNRRKSSKKPARWSPLLIIAMAIITSPIWITIACTGIGIIIGLVSLAVGAIIALACSVVGFLGTAVVCAIIGFIRLFTIPIVGIFLIGVSFILFALGLLFLVLNIWFFRFGLPKCIQWIGSICKAPFRSRKTV